MRFIDLNKEEEIIIKEKIKKNEIGENNIIKLNNHNILLLSRLFVGTPEYVSPEVLEHDYENIGPSVDIWAFGIILYLFFFGKTPFKGKNEEETLDNIKNIKYNFEEDDKNNISEEAKDLISKILIKDPCKRIGYNSYDYNEIKNHPFFKGINFDNLEKEQKPVLDIKETLEEFGYQIEKILTEEERHFSIIKELYEEEKEDIDKTKEENINIKSKSEKNIGINIRELKNDLKGKTIEYKNIITNELKEEDKIIIEEKLQKKSPWFHYNTRLVIFYSKGHIDYFEPNTRKLKGSFIINSQCKANIIDEYRFEIQTPNRNYIFKHKTKKVSNDWVEAINKYIDNLAEKNNK